MVQGVWSLAESNELGSEQVSNEQQGRDSLKVEPAGFLLSGNATLHHLGFVVASISAVAEEFAASMSANWDGVITHDPIQRVRVAFFAPVDPRNPVFELVEPASEVSPVSNFLKKRGGLHHVCYEIDDLELALPDARRAGLGIVAAPAPAVAFAGRRIAWVCSKTRLLVELLERNKK
jgi:methylmalonyl-CoA/ethylmalonyl-CoA epimerase